MSKVLKLAAIKLAYLEVKGIYIKDINTHSLRYGITNALHLEGYKDRETKNVSMEVIYIKGLHIIPIALILQRCVNGHEKSTKENMFQGRGYKEHYNVNDDRCIL